MAASTLLIDRDKIIPYVRDFIHPQEEKMNVITFGPPGTGKTTLGWQARMEEQLVFEITCTSEQPAAVWTGFFVPRGDRFEYLDGTAVKAWLGTPRPDGTYRGALLIINEIDKASPDVMDVLHVVCDDPSIARLYLPDGRAIAPAPNFWVWATTNALLEDLPEPIQDRFPVRIAVWEPGSQQLDKLSPAVREVCTNLYQSVKGTGMSPQFTYRELRSFDKLLQVGSPVAVAAAVTAKTPTAASALVEAYNLAKPLAVVRDLHTAQELDAVIATTFPANGVATSGVPSGGF